MIRAFLLWLQSLGRGSGPDAQSWSETLHGSLNFWNMMEGMHLITLMLFAGTILVVDLRLLGVTFRKVKISVLSEKLLPLTVFGFAMMVVTGLIVFFAKPVEYYHNIWFRVKILFILVAMINIVIFHFRVQKNEAAWDDSPSPPWSAKASAIVSITAWVMVIIMGRFIAYNWFECGKPLSGFLNAAEECAASDAGANQLKPVAINAVTLKGGADMHPALIPLKFSALLPNIRPWVLNLANIWPAPFVKPNFAIFEVFHILTLIVLGGSSIVVGLRLIRTGLTEERPSTVWDDMKLYLHIGIWGVFLTGIVIGMANAERLYDSAAFMAKMMCLLGGIILVYGSTRSIAKADGVVSTGAYVWGAIGVLFWIAAIAVFLTGGLITPGLYHMLTAAALIAAFVTRGRLRWIYLIGLALILCAMFVTTHVIFKMDDTVHGDPANVVLAWIAAAWIFGCAGWRTWVTTRGMPGQEVFVRIVGYVTILIWVTAAAAGRWIAFA